MGCFAPSNSFALKYYAGNFSKSSGKIILPLAIPALVAGVTNNNSVQTG